jgi:hypothetical protein
MNASRYEREPSVAPATIETMAGLRRKFRRGDQAPASAESRMPDLFEMLSEANVFPSRDPSALLCKDRFGVRGPDSNEGADGV